MSDAVELNFNLDGEQLAKIIKAFSVASKDFNDRRGGIFIKFDQGSLYVLATNGYVALRQLVVNVECNGMDWVNGRSYFVNRITQNSIEAITKMFEGFQKPAKCIVRESDLIIKKNGISVTGYYQDKPLDIDKVFTDSKKQIPDTSSKENIQIGFNPLFLAHVSRYFSDERSIKMSFNKEMHKGVVGPILFNSIGKDLELIVMPMKI